MVLWFFVACSHSSPPPPVDSGASTAGTTGICPAARFESAGEWDNEDLPTVAEVDGRDPGLGVGDLDGDGDEDLVYAWAGNTQIFFNDAGTLSPAPPLTIDGHAATRSRAVALTDLDDDGNLDLLLGYDVPASDQLLWNDGTGLSYRSFTLPNSKDTTWSAAFADFDGDGFTDLYTATYAVPFDVDLITAGGVKGTGHAFWMQRQPQVWVQVPVPPEVDSAVSLQGAILDADQDGRLDLYMVNDFGPYVLPNRLLHNDGNSQFTVDSACSCDLSIYSMGAGVGDVDGDGTPDLVISDIGTPHLLLNDGTGAFFDASRARLHVDPAPDRMTSWGTAQVDLDLDGDNDVALAYGSLGPNGSGAIGQIANTDPSWTEQEIQHASILVNDGTGEFSLLPDANFGELGRNRAVVVTDLDGDDRPDLVLAGRDHVQAWRNVGGCEQGLVVHLVGPPGDVSAFGAKVEVEVDGHLSTHWELPGTTGSQSTREIFVGLQGKEQADSVVVTWRDGTQTILNDVPAGPVEVAWNAA